MNILIIQFNDVHIKSPRLDNPILERTEAIVAAINSAIGLETTHCFFLIAGDSAHSGKAAEFVLSVEFFNTIVTAIRKRWPDLSTNVFCIPGNHDCDLSGDQSAREALIPTLTTDAPAQSIADIILRPLDAYFDFAQRLTLGQPGLSESNPFVAIVEVKVGDTTLRFNLINSAWTSRNPGKPSTISLPVGMLKQKLSVSSSVIQISVLHHPLSWYTQETMRPLRHLLEEVSDLILTGHEHIPDSYRIARDAESEADYVEGGVLQDSTNPDTSSFNIIFIKSEQGQREVVTFTRDSDGVYRSGVSRERPLTKMKRLTANGFIFQKSFSLVLDDPGANITHPYKERISLSDIFIFPDLRLLDANHTRETTRIVSHHEVVETIFKKQKALISGDEKSGKTSFSKHFMGDVIGKNLVPILIDGEKLKNSTEQGIVRQIELLFKTQYDDADIDRFWQLPKASRAVIIDDFQKCHLGLQGKNAILRTLQHRFEIVVLIASDEIKIEEFEGADKSGNELWAYTHFEILPLGYLRREALSRKWHILGRTYLGDEPDLQEEIKRSDELISQVLRRDLVPAYPLFVIILLQQVHRGEPSVRTGSAGYLYEVLITAALSRSVLRQIDLDVKYNYLAQLANNLYSLRQSTLSDIEARHWHSDHCQAYAINLEYEAMRNDLSVLGLLDVDEAASVSFRYKFTYCFFVAWQLSNRINETETKLVVRKLSERLHHEESANILVFLAHFSKDPSIVDAVVETAESLFKDAPEADLDKGVGFFSKLQILLPQLTLPSSDPADNRRNMLQKQDEALAGADKSESSGRMVTATPTENDGIDTDLRLALELNAAFKTIRILGQILRNSAGSLKGETKFKLVKKIYSLGLRVLGGYFRSLEKDLEPYSASVFAKIKERTREISDEDARTKVNRQIFGLSEMIALVVVQHISDSVGMNLMAGTFKQVIDESPNIANRIIDLSVKLDHIKGFPKNEAISLAEESKRNPFTLTLLKILVWHHFYLYKEDYRLKQAVCEKLNISLAGRSNDQRPKQIR